MSLRQRATTGYLATRVCSCSSKKDRNVLAHLGHGVCPRRQRLADEGVPTQVGRRRPWRPNRASRTRICTSRIAADGSRWLGKKLELKLFLQVGEHRGAHPRSDCTLRLWSAETADVRTVKGRAFQCVASDASRSVHRAALMLSGCFLFEPGCEDRGPRPAEWIQAGLFARMPMPGVHGNETLVRREPSPGFTVENRSLDARVGPGTGPWSACGGSRPPRAFVRGRDVARNCRRPPSIDALYRAKTFAVTSRPGRTSMAGANKVPKRAAPTARGPGTSSPGRRVRPTNGSRTVKPGEGSRRTKVSLPWTPGMGILAKEARLDPFGRPGPAVLAPRFKTKSNRIA